jgi:hypothetical protein
MTEEETIFTAAKVAAAICGAAIIVGLSLTFCTPARAQGIYMLNGRATPSVIAGPDGYVHPVIPGPQFAGPSPLLLAPPLPFRARVGPYAPIIPAPPTEYYAPVVPRSSAPIYAPPPSYRSAPALPPQPQARQVEPPHGRGLRSTPPAPIPGAPFERDPNDRGD